MDIYQGDLSITACLDNDGNPECAIVDFSGTDTFTNSVTGKSYTETFHKKEFADLKAECGLQPVKRAAVGVAVKE